MSTQDRIIEWDLQPGPEYNKDHSGLFLDMTASQHLRQVIISTVYGDAVTCVAGRHQAQPVLNKDGTSRDRTGTTLRYRYETTSTVLVQYVSTVPVQVLVRVQHLYVFDLPNVTKSTVSAWAVPAGPGGDLDLDLDHQPGLPEVLPSTVQYCTLQ